MSPPDKTNKTRSNVKVGWLDLYCLVSCSKILHLYRDLTSTGEGLHELGLYIALMVFDQGGTSCCDTGLRFSWSPPKNRPS